MTLGTKLVASFLACGLIPVGVVAYISYSTADGGMADIEGKGSADLEKQAFNQLVALRDVKRGQVETYFSERQGDMGVLMETAATLRREAFNKLEAVQMIKKNQLADFLSAMEGQLHVVKDNPWYRERLEEFDHAFMEAGDSIDSDAWRALAQKWDHVFKNLCDDSGWYDVFLMCPEGSIVYTMSKESDLGMFVDKEPLQSSSLGRAFQKLQADKSLEIAVGDFEPYAPSNNEPAAFMMARVKNDAGEVVGHVAFQISLDRINHIMAERTGMGETGEVYLVGPDKLMRSDSYLDSQHHSVKASFANPDKGAVDTEASREALAGRDGSKVISDYNGNPVLSCYDPVRVGDVTWAIIAEMDVAEAFCPKDENGEYFFKKYIAQYGYYDLFLINPDGYCFYTVCHEQDYQTNLVNGKYSSSNLGGLVRTVFDSKDFGFADFRAYAPSNGAQAAFVAQPIVYEGKTELVVALQLPEDQINAMMGVRAGLGETGCTYLVAKDNGGKISFRSDLTFMDEKYKVGYPISTPYIEESLATAGAEKDAIFKDSHGNGVLVAYTAVDVFGEHWALIAKIDEVEALAAVKQMNDTATAAGASLLTWVGAVAAIAAVLVTLVSVAIARSISKPINRIIAGLTDGAQQVNDAAAQVSSASQSLAEGASEQASSLEETSSSLEEMAAMTRTNAENAKQANELSAQARQAAQGGDETMEQLNGAMTAINDSAGQISKIIKVIEEIAFQTNLLALNAAVEAARAGEHGKGFAVVADEVRNLAQRAAQAARETTDLIEGSVTNAREGAEVAGQVGEALGAIVSDVTKVTDLIDGIAQASQEQAQGVDQINAAVSQMDKVTQQNASGAEESASASEELSAQAQAVQGIVNELAALIHGNQTHQMQSSTRSGAKSAGSRIKVAHPRPTKAPVSAGAGRGLGSKNDFMPLEGEGDVNDF